MTLYLLTHEKQYDDGSTDGKHIGFYFSIEDAKLRIEKYKTIAGFRDYPDDFVIKEVDVKMSWFRKKKRITSVYFLQHEYSIGVADFVTELGVFSNYFEALKAKRRAMRDDKFRKYPKGFSIDKHEINEDNWTEGFVEFPFTEDDCMSNFPK